MRTDGVGSRGGLDATALGVLAVAALALAVRLVGLGARVMHWDEGRVGYWILRYHENGEFFYRPIIHGPFLPVVNDYVFTVLPPTDFSARLVVAVVGGLFPLAALLFRDRLRNAETVALSLFLAADPLLVYYSRFMRSDVIVAVFSVFALGFVVRGIDRRNPAYFVPAGAAFATGLAAKENGLLYLACFAGAGVLLFDHYLVRRTREARSASESRRSPTHAAESTPPSVPDGGEDAGPSADADWGGEAESETEPLLNVRAVLAGELRRTRRRLSAWAGDLWTGVGLVGVYSVGAVLAFLAVTVFFYAPRPELWTALANPTQLPGVFETATVGSWEKFYSTWASGTHQSHDYAPYAKDLVETLVYGSGVLLVFALIGFVADGYGEDRPRDLVAFSMYWGVASLVGYPIATDIQAPWAAVHVVVAFAIPAGVGGGYVYRVARRSLSVDDAVGTGIAALVVLAAMVGVVGANATYVNAASEDQKELLQWAQPENDLKETLADVERVSRTNPGEDVLFFGTCNPAGGACDRSDMSDALFYVKDESSLQRMPPGGPAWHSRLPIPWYFESYGANVTSSHPNASTAAVLDDAPPVVVAYRWNASDIEPHLPGYEKREHRFKLWGEHVVIFVDRSALRASTRTDRDAPDDGRQSISGGVIGAPGSVATAPGAADVVRPSAVAARRAASA
ncbi:flippase activity-associated protein Agl23 [Halobium salinum]|uniref:Flippase activity-associated protein Agl23 n=1 Tax=Halobium salinum TaxID=1364940 RepID=A0ABD5PGL2_9EURY|nr:flippase activity-associated protein Agl23 [Halobium salinum]